MTHEGLELASQRRLVPDADRPLPIVGTDFNQSVPSTIENCNGGVENNLDATPMLRPSRGDLEHTHRIGSKAGGHSPDAIDAALSDGFNHLWHKTEDFAHDGQIVRQQRPDRIDVFVRVTPPESPGAYHANRSKLAAPCQRAECLDAGVIAPLVHHEQPISGQRNCTFCIFGP